MALRRDDGLERAARRPMLVRVATDALRARGRSPEAELRRRARIALARVGGAELAPAELTSYFDDLAARGRLGY